MRSSNYEALYMIAFCPSSRLFLCLIRSCSCHGLPSFPSNASITHQPPPSFSFLFQKKKSLSFHLLPLTLHITNSSSQKIAHRPQNDRTQRSPTTYSQQATYKRRSSLSALSLLSSFPLTSKRGHQSNLSQP